MPHQKENGLILEEKNGMIYLMLKLTIKRRMLWTFVILLIATLFVLGSSLGEDTRKIILDFLIGVLQMVVFTERHSQS